MADPKNPPSFKDALVDASQAIAGGVGAADYDATFAGHLLSVIGMFLKPKQAQGQPPAGGAGGAPSSPPAGGPPGADAGGPPPGSTPPSPGSAGGPPQPGQGAQTPPGAPVPGGMTQGLSPSPDELRRVLSDVAGK